MAKLSAHGKELLRISQEKDITDPEESITWARWMRAYMADGKILQKYDVTFKPTQFERSPRPYSYGWKLYGKIKKELNVADVVRGKVELIQAGKSKWAIVGTLGIPASEPIVILDAKRVMRAIESGESIGFCKACGADQEGCEPDARNYTCESCGKPEVYGAEECLMGI